MARDFLLDTNTLSYWFDTKCPEHAKVKARVLTLRNSAQPPTLFMSSISLGEIEYGHHASRPLPGSTIQTQFLAFLDNAVLTLDVRRGTAIEYGPLRAALFERYAPKKRIKGLRVEQLVNPITAKSLQIQENDLWIASQAMEYDLTLVTHDAMEPIRRCADDRLQIEDWAA